MWTEAGLRSDVRVATVAYGELHKVGAKSELFAKIGLPQRLDCLGSRARQSRGSK